MPINKMSKGVTYLIVTLVILPISVANGAGYQPSTPAPAAATPSPTPSTSNSPDTRANKSLATELLRVNSILAKKDYKSARTALLLLDAEFANNADINNLLGFSSRKLKDYKASASYYTKALAINPSHLGALEYQGELFITTKKIADAKKNLQKLKSLCGITCSEYKDLKKAIGNL